MTTLSNFRPTGILHTEPDGRVFAQYVEHGTGDYAEVWVEAKDAA